MVKKQQLRWSGHVSRSSGIAKTILQGTVKGKSRRDGLNKKWKENIKELTGMDSPDQLGQLKTEQGEKGLLQSQLWCPDNLPRLWDGTE